MVGQIQISNILSEHYPKYLSYQQVMELTETSKTSVLRCLKQLAKRDEIELKIIWGKKLRSGWKTLYRFKGG